MATPDKDVFRRAFVVYLLMLAVAIVIIYRILQIQWSLGPAILENSKKVPVKYITIKPTRGNIYSDDGSLLATSVPRFDIALDFSPKTVSEELFKKEIDSLCIHLSKLFGDKTWLEYKTQLTKIRHNGSRFVYFKKNLDYYQLKQLKQFPIFREGRYRGGFIYERSDRREMPFNLLAKRTIGYIRNDYYVGLEGAYDSVLCGRDGKQLVQSIGGQSWMPINDQEEIKPVDGNDIVTTIDIHLQDVAETALYEQLKENGAHHGCVVLMEVQTGEIKAIANLTRTESGDYYEGYNYAIGESSEPGSTFKLMTMLVALEDHKINLEEKINTGNGVFEYGGQVMKDSHEGGYGTITMRQVFEYSSNIGFIKYIAKAYGANPKQFTDGLYRLGLNKPIGLEIKGEGLPYIKNPKSKDWNKKVSLPWMALGYELSLTPMQTLLIYNAVANDGVMMKPMFVKEIRKADKTIRKIEPTVLNPRLCSKETIEQAQRLLEGVVIRGTAKSLSKAPFPIAGKTGTAQVANNAAGYRKNGGVSYKASFVGYFPADNPRYSCIVVINEPTKGQYYGAAVAAPVFLEIAEKVYSTQLDIHYKDTISRRTGTIPRTAGRRDEIFEVFRIMGRQLNGSASGSELIKISGGDEPQINLIKTNINLVPDVRGLTAKDAVFILEQRGLKVIVRGRGKVNAQSITAGSPVKKGQAIIITLNII